MNKPATLMTKSQFAAYRGVQKSAVSNWAKRDLLVFAEDPTDRSMKIDVKRTEARLNANVDPTRGRPTKAQAQSNLPLEGPAPSPRQPEPAGQSLADVRTDLIRAQTRKAELDNAKRAGELVPLEEFTRRATEFARVTRERMLSVVRSQSERVAAEKDPRRIVALLEDDINAAFADMAAQIAAGQLVAEGEPEEEDPEIDAAMEAAMQDTGGDPELEAVG